MRSSLMLLVVAGVLASAPAWPHGDAHKKEAQPRDAHARISPEEHPFGRQGDPKKVSRTVRIDMADTMRYTPAEITVKRGETVAFEVRNKGQVMHEIVFGTMSALREHAELMRKHPGMEHDEPYMAHVAPGKSGRIVWQFTKPGEFHYGCLVPGHFEAGMVGKVIVK